MMEVRSRTANVEYITKGTILEDGTISCTVKAKIHMRRDRSCPACDETVHLRYEDHSRRYLSKCSMLEEKAILNNTGLSPYLNKDCTGNDMSCPYCATELVINYINQKHTLEIAVV